MIFDLSGNAGFIIGCRMRCMEYLQHEDVWKEGSYRWFGAKWNPTTRAGAWAGFQGFLHWSGLPSTGLDLTDGWGSAREMHGSKSLSKSCCWGIGILTISCQSSCPYTLKRLCFVYWSSKVLMLFCRQFLRKIYRLSLTPMYISCLLHQASSGGNSKKSFYQGPALIKA